ncbi:hypothetical protein HPB48_021729 [Haemaphysalis longicornis]|uniref:Uncharacterized protein n=1 Tax=Haemaphysalis longicornis TaxID=44386 RepID=A0A9J6FYJ9_HAELO|nr:hypothetical protein HPB48_021729 [Haemaphysalis longicornis]
MKCDSCLFDEDGATLKARGNYFVIFDLKEQVKHLIAREKDFLFENLLWLKRDTEQGFCASVKDITSRFMLRNLRESRQVKWCDLTITVITGGSPVFKSSTSSVWPIQFVINELPPDYRLKNSLVGGLWFGKHPEMTVFLKKFVDELNEFGEVIWKKGSTVITSSLYAVCSCVDVPARALVSSGAVRYTNIKMDEERNPQETREEMMFALSVEESVNGVKGPSAFMNVKHFNLVFGQTVDYMHCVLIGVTKAFTDHLFDLHKKGPSFCINE